MTKHELIDAVKRWQVAVALVYQEDEWFKKYLDIRELYRLDERNDAMNTFLALLERLDEWDILPPFSDRGDEWLEIEDDEEFTEPGVGFSG